MENSGAFVSWMLENISVVWEFFVASYFGQIV
jgi:hypothetical protein